MRLGIFFCGAMLSGAFGGLFAAGIAAAFKNNRLPSWRWLFIIEGAATVVFAFVTGFIIPDWPATTKWLSEEEKALGVVRLVEDAGDEEEEITVMQSLKMASKDYRVWLCILGQVRKALHTCLGQGSQTPNLDVCSSGRISHQLPPDSCEVIRLRHHRDTASDCSALHPYSPLLSLQYVVFRPHIYAIATYYLSFCRLHCWDRNHNGDHQHWRSLLCTLPHASRLVWLLPGLECMDGKYRRSTAEEACHRPGYE